MQFAHPPLPRGVTSIPVLKNVSLELEPGQVTVLSRSSGCSRSTLLQIISGLLKPDSGTVAWDNQDLERTLVHRWGFAMLFQGGEPSPDRDVAGNIAYGLEMRRPRPTRAQREARVAQMLRLVHPEDYENRGVSTLSGEQTGRVTPVRALAPTSRLLLLDKPSATLDEQLRCELARDTCEILKASDNTALCVTHDQSEAELVADRVSTIYQGEIVAQGSLELLRCNPPNPGVAKFSGL